MTTSSISTGDIKAQSEAEDVGWFTLPEITGLEMHPLLRSVLERVK